eukprot:359640-Prorocentrum_lima.AAC.1
MCPAASAVALGQRGAPFCPKTGPRQVGSHQGAHMAVRKARLRQPAIFCMARGGKGWIAALYGITEQT